MQLLERSTPEAQGVDTKGILSFIDAITGGDITDEMHSLMILRHGKVITEGWWAPYGRDIPQEIYSLSKSFAAVAIGFAVHEGILSVDDLVLDFFADEIGQLFDGEPSEYYKALTVKDLLTMSDGQERDIFVGPDTYMSRDWVKLYFSVPIVRAPGSQFSYNTGSSYILSVLLEKASGLRLDRYLKPRLFKPLGFGPHKWISCPKGHSTGGFGLACLTEDIAKFGQCLMQDGVWEGKQIIPKAWIEVATSTQIANGENMEHDWEQGYGYQFWRCRHGAYRGDGAFGQYCIVMPEQNMVVAMTAGTREMGAKLEAVWEYLMPSVSEDALPENRRDYVVLQKMTASFAVSEPEAIDEELDSHAGNYKLDQKLFGMEDMSLLVDDSSMTMIIGDDKRQVTVDADVNGWTDQELPYGAFKMLCKMKAYKTGKNEVTLIRRIIHTPHSEYVRISYDNESFEMTVEQSVTFEEESCFVLTGKPTEKE